MNELEEILVRNMIKDARDFNVRSDRVNNLYLEMIDILIDENHEYINQRLKNSGMHGLSGGEISKKEMRDMMRKDLKLRH